MSRDDDKDNDRTESVGDLGEGPDRPRIKKLGHFRIDATLGSGGMGTIYRAYDESMKRPVALKVLHSSLEISQRAQSRFVREAWIAGQLDHPNIVKVYYRGEENNVSYLAMELAEGGSLYDFIKRTRESIPSGSDITGTSTETISMIFLGSLSSWRVLWSTYIPRVLFIAISSLITSFCRVRRSSSSSLTSASPTPTT